jgi:hypothetical protein
MVNRALLRQGKRTVNCRKTAGMRVVLPFGAGTHIDHGKGIPKILIECGRFKFSENMLRIRFEISPKRSLRRNAVFNGLC